MLCFFLPRVDIFLDVSKKYNKSGATLPPDGRFCGSRLLRTLPGEITIAPAKNSSFILLYGGFSASADKFVPIFLRKELSN